MRISITHEKAEETTRWLMALDALLQQWTKGKTLANHIATAMHLMAEGMTPQEAHDWLVQH
ncbi:hypothetical protein NKI86_32445 [Mesorhizobium sp. M0320]|uniref:hypothetical protein n=1 Tax=Mesorhizobium sp. M0320 TaxID=2956936 RepID=UPI003335D10C